MRPTHRAEFADTLLARVPRLSGLRRANGESDPSLPESQEM